MWFPLKSASWRIEFPCSRRKQIARLSLEWLESRALLSAVTLDPLVQVSGPSPFNGCVDQPEFGRNAETEPAVAANPTDPDHIVAAWIQDFAVGIVSGVSRDGGASWQTAAVPDLTLCSGGTRHTASDPWVAIAPNGDVYVSSIQNNFFQPHQQDWAIRVNKSTDGGQTWGPPITLIENSSAGRTNHNSSITADPHDANYVYAVWFQAAHGDRARNEVLFSRTTDGGLTWEPPRVVHRTPNNDFRSQHQVLVQPDGTLVILSVEEVIQGNSTDQFLSVFRSTDRGATWSEPIRGPQILWTGAIDPETGQEVADGVPDYAVDPLNGNLYAVWNDNRFLGGQYESIAWTISTDGGLTWLEPVKINKTPTDIAPANQQAILPNIEVAADGTVGITYYDFRNNTPAAGLPTDYWFIHADPGADLTDPAGWNELRLNDTSFDMETAVFLEGLRGYFLGDKVGLAVAGNDFVPLWSMPHGTDLASTFSRRVRRTGGSSVLAESFGNGAQTEVLTSESITPLLGEAAARWEAAGVDTSSLGNVQIVVADLSGPTLGMATGNSIWLDDDAAGWDWFIDATSDDESEFFLPGNQGEQDRMDLLTVVMHETGHRLGRNHDEDGVMADTLTTGMRQSNLVHDHAERADEVFAQSAALHADAWLSARWVGQWHSTRPGGSRRMR